MPLTTFFAAALVLAITPGPGLTYVVARTIGGGRAGGLASCIGTALGGMIHVLAAATGLSLLLAQSAVAFTVVKYLGAVYLIYMGIQLLLARKKADETSDVVPLPTKSPRRALLDGILVETLNVKTALFFIAFLPQFVDPTGSMIWQLVMLGMICLILNTLADVAAVLFAARLLVSDTARRARERIMQCTSGVIMIFLGVFLAFADNEA